MTREFLGAVDAGTTSVRTVIFDLKGREVASASRPIRTFHPFEGWAEQDPEDLRRLASLTLREALSCPQVRKGHVLGIGLANQRESTVAVDARSGRALSPVILWHDTRTLGLSEDFGAGGWAQRLWRQGGLPLTTYPSAPKMAWLLRNIPAVRKAAHRGGLRFLTVDSLVADALLQGPGRDHRWMTERSNASRTLLLDLATCRYEEEALEHFGLDREMLPELLPSWGQTFGLAGKDLPLVSILGDQQASLLGLTWYSGQAAKLTLGTGAFLLMQVGRGVQAMEHGLIRTVLSQPAGARASFGLEGAVGTAGSFFDWFGPGGLGLFSGLPEMERMARRSRGHREVVVPAFSGLFAPYWQTSARGAVLGLGLESGRADIARAAFDGLAHRIADLTDTVRAATGEGLDALTVDGGLSRSRHLLQRISDYSGVTLKVAPTLEGTAWGAALAAGFGLGVLSPSEAGGTGFPGREIVPGIPPVARRQLRERWAQSVLTVSGKRRGS